MELFDPAEIQATGMSSSSEKNSPSPDLVVPTTSPLVTERKKRHRSRSFELSQIGGGDQDAAVKVGAVNGF